MITGDDPCCPVIKCVISIVLAGFLPGNLYFFCQKIALEVFSFGDDVLHFVSVKVVE